MNTLPDLDVDYQRSLLEIRQMEPQNRLLSKFWTHPAGWPQGNGRFMFIGEAISTVGRAKYQDDWTDAEFGARRSVSSFPEFEGTLLYHFNSGGETRREPQSSSASASRAIEYGKRLAAENENLRPQYAAMAAKWEAIRPENGPLRRRLEWVVHWLAAKGRDAQLETYLRKVDTAHQASDYSKAPGGFWETENTFRDRLRNGYVKLPDSSDPSADSELERYYIFLPRKNVEYVCSELAQAEFGPEDSDLHYSIYMQLMRRAIAEYRINPENQPKKSSLVAYFKDQWPGDKPLSDNMANAMASLTREPERQFGRAWKLADNG